MSDKKTKQRVADAILQAEKEITICGNVYEVTPPSIATLVLASKEMANFPAIEINQENAIYEVLAVADKYANVSKVVAIMILGAKRISEKITTKTLFGLKTVEKENQELENLTTLISENMQPSEVFKLFTQLLGGLQVADFFYLITSLNEVNQIRKTKI